MRQALLACIILATGSANPAQARDRAASLVAGVTAGSLGVGPEVALRISPRIAVRANALFFGLGHSVQSGDIDYDGDIRLASAGAILDFLPFSYRFRVSGGLRFNRNKVDVLATPAMSEVFVIGGEAFRGPEIGELRGTVTTRRVAPVFTLGYGGRSSTGVSLTVDAGVMLQGRPTVRDLRASGPVTADPNVPAALAREEDEIREDVGKYRVYPVLQVTLGYAF